MTSAKLKAKSHRWVAWSADFNFTIKYWPGKQLANGDGLSCMPLDFDEFTRQRKWATMLAVHPCSEWCCSPMTRYSGRGSEVAVQWPPTLDKGVMLQSNDSPLWTNMSLFVCPGLCHKGQVRSSWENLSWHGERAREQLVCWAAKGLALTPQWSNRPFFLLPVIWPLSSAPQWPHVQHARQWETAELCGLCSRLVSTNARGLWNHIEDHRETGKSYYRSLELNLRLAAVSSSGTWGREKGRASSDRIGRTQCTKS